MNVSAAKPAQQGTYEFHPFSDIWPLLEGEEFDRLALDIAANGLKLPIILYQDMILDGRNRYRGCLKASVAPVFEDAKATGDEAALKLVVSMNDHRRHLSYEQRAFAAARLANIQHGGDRRSDKIKISDEPLIQKDDHKYHRHSTSILEASKLMDVTPAATKRAKAVIEHGDKQLEKDVVKRRIKLTTACEKVRPKRAKPTGPVDQKRGLPMAARVPVIDTSKRRVLTPQEVDPEFKGTSNEFTTKYGHVQLETAEERATNRFAEWSMHIRKWAKDYKQFPLSPIDVNWLRSPKAKDAERFLEAYATLALVFDNIQDIKAKIESLRP